jgi:hypothetical protein
VSRRAKSASGVGYKQGSNGPSYGSGERGARGRFRGQATSQPCDCIETFRVNAFDQAKFVIGDVP